ncbi:MAG: DsbA family protein [Marinovum sp.]|nr:DsbA family protein [Marinovum sp.]
MLRKLSFTLGAVAVLMGAGLWLSWPSSVTTEAEFTLPFAATAQTDDSEPSEVEIVNMVQGDENAPITVVEYASLTCPHCASFHKEVYKDLKTNYIDSGKIRFEFREVYFDKFGIWASMIARCTGPDRYFGVIDLMMSTQSTWARSGDDLAIISELRKIGRLAGLQDDQLQSCLQNADKLRALVAWYKENATRDGIRSTPTFLIDGEVYKNMNYDDFAAVLDEKLAEK